MMKLAQYWSKLIVIENHDPLDETNHMGPPTIKTPWPTIRSAIEMVKSQGGKMLIEGDCYGDPIRKLAMWALA